MAKANLNASPTIAATTVAEATISYTMSEDTFLDIADTAGYAIGYWADSAEIRQCIYRVHVLDDDTKETFELGPEDFAAAVLKLATGAIKASYAQEPCRALVLTDDAGEIDGEVADLLVQIACFGEVVYG